MKDCEKGTASQTPWPSATTSAYFLDSIRDLLATATKVCEDRDNLLNSERAADATIGRLEEKASKWKRRAIECASHDDVAEWKREDPEL